MDDTEIRYFVEAALLAAGRPLSVDQLKALFDEDAAPEKAEIRQALSDLDQEYAPRGLTIGEVASGFRIQIKTSMAERLGKLWEERPPRYSRALFETLALIAYRQPMTRGEIEEIRGVSVSSNIIRSLLDREWIRVVGHRDVPGRPAMFGTTRLFLDYFGLKKLEDLPPLADLSDWETLRVQLNLPAVNEEEVRGESAEIHTLLQPDPDDGDDADADADDDDDEDTFEEISSTRWPEESADAEEPPAERETENDADTVKRDGHESSASNA